MSRPPGCRCPSVRRSWPPLGAVARRREMTSVPDELARERDTAALCLVQRATDIDEKEERRHTDEEAGRCTCTRRVRPCPWRALRRC
jgi:hypothetical protein